jgi:adenylate kinase family enzyme
MTDKTAYIFVGQSGSGKGTQAKLLDSALREENPLLTIFHIETGQEFRAMIERDTYIISRTKEYMDAGKLPPSFLGVYSWAESLINQYNAEDALIIDGTPRITEEVPILMGALQFINAKIVVISINVSDDWARDKATKRGRSDDRDMHELDGRLAWYHQQVEPVVTFFKTSDAVSYIEINGEQPIEAVQADILRELAIVAPVPKSIWNNAHSTSH